MEASVPEQQRPARDSLSEPSHPCSFGTLMARLSETDDLALVAASPDRRYELREDFGEQFALDPVHLSRPAFMASPEASRQRCAAGTIPFARLLPPSVALPPAPGRGNTHGLSGKRAPAELREPAGEGPARARRRTRALEPSRTNIAGDTSLGPKAGRQFKNELRANASISLGIEADTRLHRSRRDAAGRTVSFTGTRSLPLERAGVHTFVEHSSNCLKRRAFMPTPRTAAERFSGRRGRERPDTRKSKRALNGFGGKTYSDYALGVALC